MPTVSIVKIDEETVESSVRRAVNLAGGIQNIVKPGSTVLIKPNIMRPQKSGCGLITDARVTEAVTKLVLEEGPEKVIIGEGASVGYDFPDFKDTWKAFNTSGTADVAKKLSVELVDLNRDKPVEVRVSDAFVMKKFKVAKTALEADVIISVPVLKTHIRTGVTGGLKNMKGVLPGMEKRRTHRSGLDRAIVDLNRIVKPDFVVVDAINCLEGTWAIPDDIVKMNLIIAGADPVSVDSVCAKIIGLDPDKVMHITLAEEVGLGVARLDKINVKGEEVDTVARRFRSYSEAFTKRFKGVKIIEKNTCTGCMGESISMLIYLREAGFEGKLAETALIMGTPEEVPEVRGSVLIIGTCAMKHRDLGVYIPGCPPHGLKITDKACEALNLDRNAVYRAIKELHKPAGSPLSE